MIFFDIDQTLLDHQQAQDMAAELFLQQFPSSYSKSPEEFSQYWQTVAEKHLAPFMRGEITFVEQRRRRMRELFQETESYLVNDEADRRFAIYLQYYEENWTLFDDVLPCLNSLLNNKLGIISNGNTQQQIKKLSHTGIIDRFDTIVISEEVGIAKPNPDIFWRACHLATVEVERCSYIGDDLQTDALAATNTGMQGIWLNRVASSDAQITIPTIKNLQELATVIPSSVDQR
jgi:putative hydrolase of the HAD superfamily